MSVIEIIAIVIATLPTIVSIICLIYITIRHRRLMKQWDELIREQDRCLMKALDDLCNHSKPEEKIKA